MKNIKKIIIFFGFLWSFSSCNEQLDTEPRQSITPEIALSDSTGFQAFLMSAYRRVYEFGYYGQTMMLAPDALADNAVIVRRTGRYESEVLNVIGAHTNIWGEAYRVVGDCNYILEDIDKVIASSNFKNRIKAEALFLRALAYHDLVKVYGYDPGKEVNGWNKGVILRTKAVKQASDADFRSRSTNQEIYTQIEIDLKESIRLFDELAVAGSPSVSFPFRANIAAPNALLARVYLYWGKNTEAITQALKVINMPTTQRGVLASTSAEVTRIFNNGASAAGIESIFECALTTTDWGSGTNGSNNSLASVTTNLVSGGFFSIGAPVELYDKFVIGDFRRTSWWNDLGVVDGVRTIMSLKWSGEKNIGFGGLENIQVLRLAEMYLIAAEAYARTNDEVNSRLYLNLLRRSRGFTTTQDITSAGSQLLDDILNENRLEFVYEGHRLFDLKRFGKSISKPVELGNLSALAPSDNRILARIPISEIRLNNKLEQNPGY